MRHSPSSLFRVLLLVVLGILLSGLAVTASAAPQSPAGDPCYIPPSKIATAPDAAIKSPPQGFIECCIVYGKAPSTAATKENMKRRPLPPPCEPDPICGIAYTNAAVVGSLPFNQQAYWAPGKLATGVSVNAGTYWVNGIGTAENGAEFYQIIVSCQYLFVPVAAMQPSYEPPWSGEALPTTAIS